MNRNMQQTWRAKRAGGEGQLVSRMKKVVEAVDNARKENGATKDSVLARFDSMMQTSGSVSRLAEDLVKWGL
jgi:hypothetical protein